MGFIGVQPASVPLTASDITDGIISNAKLGADSVNASKVADDSISEEHLDITAITGHSAITSLADTDKFLVSDASDSNNLKYVEKQYLGGGGALEFISSVSVTTTVSSTGFGGSTFSSTYDNYYFVLHNILNGIDDQSVYMRFRDTSGNVLSGSEYDWVHVGGNTAGTQVNNSSANDTAIHLLKNKDLQGTGGNSNANKGYVEGIVFSPHKLSYASNDNLHCSVVWRGTFPRSTHIHTLHGSATYTEGTQLGGFQIYGGGGGGPNYTDRFEGAIYGIKRS